MAQPHHLVITGAGRGIGRALAEQATARGARVVLCARSAHELTEVTETLRHQHGAQCAHAVVCDVGSTDDVQRLHDEAARFFEGPVTTVVNNAGIVRRGLIHETDDTLWSDTLNVNLTGAFRVSRAFLPQMRAAHRGRVLFVSSISATLGSPTASAYCASKWALLGLMKTLAEENRAHGVQSMAVLPGSVDTQMLVGSGFAPAMTADDVAKTLAFLAFDAPDAMTSSAIEVFG